MEDLHSQDLAIHLSKKVPFIYLWCLIDVMLSPHKSVPLDLGWETLVIREFSAHSSPSPLLVRTLLLFL